ncbi:MAG: hypothetical protein HY000_15015 [Planctomycetes bacterium]|nr:hypothetical protein [Planctomycetota bacterium]
MKGPAIFLAQLLRDQPPFDQLPSLARWVAERGYIGVQIPAWDRRAIDLDCAAESQAYCDDLRAALAVEATTVAFDEFAAGGATS